MQKAWSPRNCSTRSCLVMPSRNSTDTVMLNLVEKVSSMPSPSGGATRTCATSDSCGSSFGAIAVVQAGIRTVVTYLPESGDDHWLESIEKSRAVFEEAGVEFLELDRRA